MPTAKPSIRLRIIFPPKNRSVDQRPATRQPGRLRFPYKGTLDEHRNDDDGTLDSADQIFADEIRQQHDIADDLEYERPADRAPNAADAAAQRGAADHDCSNGLQLPHKSGR